MVIAAVDALNGGAPQALYWSPDNHPIMSSISWSLSRWLLHWPQPYTFCTCIGVWHLPVVEVRVKLQKDQCKVGMQGVRTRTGEKHSLRKVSPVPSWPQ